MYPLVIGSVGHIMIGLSGALEPPTGGRPESLLSLPGIVLPPNIDVSEGDHKANSADEGEARTDVKELRQSARNTSRWIIIFVAV